MLCDTGRPMAKRRYFFSGFTRKLQRRKCREKRRYSSGDGAKVLLNSKRAEVF